MVRGCVCGWLACSQVITLLCPSYHFLDIAVMTRSRRWPLMIDPQLQAVAAVFTRRRTNLIGRRQVPGSISHTADIADALVVRRKEDAPRACWKMLKEYIIWIESRTRQANQWIRKACTGPPKSKLCCHWTCSKEMPGENKVLLPKVLKSSPFPIGAASRSFPLRFVWSVAYGVRKRRTTSHPSFDSELCSRAQRPEAVWHPIATEGKHMTHAHTDYRHLQTGLNDRLNTGRVCCNKVQLPTASRHC